ncbi:GNAT family N-acetyltransferase [Duganella sp. FT134W]|uniref:GNAT family N-acetyltransferase n=1 Tax=Duganella margarita TaxID=2692170 RepID=A0A7X4H2X9_9BURK|nr:GNAT family N-acetyltransferase [Duganella margarita]MYM74338.1 GNAT family N-acetyltransferase [Duganella margarita]
MKILDTERLRLRTITPDDAAFYYALVNDPSWIEHIGDKGIRSVEGARIAIIDGPCAMQQRLGHSLYVMERKSDGQALGLCGLIKRDSLPDVDIGYAIRPAYFGQGYTYEAASAVVAYARDVLGMKRLMGITNPHNTVSINLLAKLGLTFIEHKPLPPDNRPTNIYQLALA